MSNRKSTNGSVRAVARALREDLELGRKLAAIAVAQTEALKANDALRVGELEAQARALTVDAAEREERRNAAVAALAEAVGLSGQGAVLSSVALRLPVDEARTLLGLRASILKLDRRLRDINDRNRMLLASALRYVEFSIQTLTALALRPAAYGANLNALSAPTFYIDRRV